MSIDQDKLGNGQVEDDQDFAVDVTLVALAGSISLTACRSIEVVQQFTEQDANDWEWHTSRYREYDSRYQS